MEERVRGDMLRVVVVGTGTGVGKTALTVSLAEHFRAEGSRVVCSKPVETGVAAEALDATALDAAAVGRPPSSTDGPHPLYAYEPPLSPHLAAALAGRPIQIAIIEGWLRERERDLSGSRDVSLVEGAGGLFTPLTDTENNLTLTNALRPSTVLLVSPNRLGVLHDALSSLALLRATLKSTPVVIVLTRALPQDTSTATNATELRRLAQLPVFDWGGPLDRAGTAEVAAQLCRH